uniref:Uncharacterized protein n=1 Tax=Molossus molossus TaxID=27622 RepID=A0A7J8F9H0_MOLMO|nr:hypothetical protein HJG59_008601 [Molossus molossus]
MEAAFEGKKAKIQSTQPPPCLRPPSHGQSKIQAHQDPGQRENHGDLSSCSFVCPTQPQGPQHRERTGGVGAVKGLKRSLEDCEVEESRHLPSGAAGALLGHWGSRCALQCGLRALGFHVAAEVLIWGLSDPVSFPLTWVDYLIPLSHIW